MKCNNCGIQIEKERVAWLKAKPLCQKCYNKVKNKGSIKETYLKWINDEETKKKLSESFKSLKKAI